MPPPVSVVVCAYTEDRWDDLVAAVGSLAGQTLAPHEVVVICDHNPALLARARAALAEATVVPNAASRGLSGGRNTGIEVARGEVVAFLDDDAVAAPDWLERLIAHYADPRVVGVGGRVVPRWDSRRPAWFPEEFDWVVGCSYRGLPTQAAPVRNPIGANMSFRREVLEEVGGFESRLGRVGATLGHCEETELGIRVGQRWPDRVTMYEPAAVVAHRVPDARCTWSYFRTRCYTEGLSKALVSKERGAGAGTASERSYALGVLPRGVGRALGEAVRRRRPEGAARAGAIAAGLAATTAGYVAGLARRDRPD